MTYRSSAKLDGTYRGSMKLSGAKSQVGVASTTHSRETRTCQTTCAAIVGVANRLHEMYGKQIFGCKAIAFLVWQTDYIKSYIAAVHQCGAPGRCSRFGEGRFGTVLLTFEIWFDGCDGLMLVC